MLLRCDGCGLKARTAELFRTYYPSVREPPQRFCPLCWDARERGQRKLGRICLGVLLGALVLFAWLHPAPEGRILLRFALLLMAAWLPSVVLHELGHAAAGLALGLRLVRLTLGSGPAYLRRYLGTTELVIRSLPTCGSVEVRGNAERWQRLRHWLVTLAGPGTNAALLLLAFAWSGLGGSTRSVTLEELGYLDALCVANGIIVFFNLLPISGSSEPGERWLASDGMLLLRIPWESSARSVPARTEVLMARAEEQLRRGWVSQALALLQQGVVLREDARHAVLCARRIEQIERDQGELEQAERYAALAAWLEREWDS